MNPWTDLDEVCDLVWSEIEAGASDPSHIFRTPTFATTGGKQPQVRTVVLRAADRQERHLIFHTDRRTGKTDDIRSGGRIAWHVWDPERSIQIRLQGDASIHTSDDVADGMWASEPAANLAHYLKSEAPGTGVSAPNDGLPGHLSSHEWSEDDVAAGRSNFAVVRTVIDQIDALHLLRGNHQRAVFAWNAGEKRFDGTWIIP
ncbi:pyridoxamine 5'-phosphate oxidase [Longibacter salinarum]|uniref:Pyridoxamine 5'-phosphate oxidase n=1 Tax=Longibacter salinarum TaxID=1850348 RepID=A0A2A8D1Z6_9BACT|nr:pyridoxamine 5'-phosphate oxidase family protein [Longibacter salinarum]PEN14979.1 pyridoxamine 5'-phosphate oxidase [Longibacter salinarum]